MRRKALATDVSTPTRENCVSKGAWAWNWTLKLLRKWSRSQSLFSPGQWPGKSLDCWLATVSVPTWSFCAGVSGWRRGDCWRSAGGAGSADVPCARPGRWPSGGQPGESWRACGRGRAGPGQACVVRLGSWALELFPSAQAQARREDAGATGPRPLARGPISGGQLLSVIDLAQRPATCDQRRAPHATHHTPSRLAH
jgi:hypothetical protein